MLTFVLIQGSSADVRVIPDLNISATDPEPEVQEVLDSAVYDAVQTAVGGLRLVLRRSVPESSGPPQATMAQSGDGEMQHGRASGVQPYVPPQVSGPPMRSLAALAANGPRYAAPAPIARARVTSPSPSPVPVGMRSGLGGMSSAHQAAASIPSTASRTQLPFQASSAPALGIPAPVRAFTAALVPPAPTVTSASSATPISSAVPTPSVYPPGLSPVS